MRKRLPERDQLLLRIGAAKKEAGRALGFVKARLPKKDQEVTRVTFTFHTDKAKLKTAEQRDGHYLLRSNLTGEDPAVLWTRYVQLTQLESVFRSLEERTRHSAHLSSTRTPGRCSCIHCVSGLLSAGDAEDPADDSRTRSDAGISVRKTFHHSDGGGVDSDAGWPVAGTAAPHTAGSRCAGIAGADPHGAASATGAANQVLAAADRRNEPARSVSGSIAATFSRSWTRFEKDEGIRDMKC
jgi:hypothetical protein